MQYSRIVAIKFRCRVEEARLDPEGRGIRRVGRENRWNFVRAEEIFSPRKFDLLRSACVMDRQLLEIGSLQQRCGMTSQATPIANRRLQRGTGQRVS